MYCNNVTFTSLFARTPCLHHKLVFIKPSLKPQTRFSLTPACVKQFYEWAVQKRFIPTMKWHNLKKTNLVNLRGWTLPIYTLTKNSELIFIWIVSENKLRRILCFCYWTKIVQLRALAVPGDLGILYNIGKWGKTGIESWGSKVVE